MKTEQRKMRNEFVGYRSRKYHNKFTIVDGHKFPSLKEAKRYQELKLLERAGKIKDLKLQVPYTLIPKEGKEREVKYVADFVYVDKENMLTIVEDVKGFRTPVYKLKKRMLKYVYGIQIKES